MKINFTNFYKSLSDKNKIFNKIKFHIRNNQFVGGESVVNFENSFSKFINSKYCVSLGNGTDALEIAIRSLNLKKNSEVIVPINTWISTAEAVVNCGFKVVFCDINLNDYTIDTNDLIKKITQKTSLIIIVHLYGNPCNISEILKISKKYKLKIIEDCAQAHGSYYNQKHVGTFADIGTFSFFPGKNLGAFGDEIGRAHV